MSSSPTGHSLGEDFRGRDGDQFCLDRRVDYTAELTPTQITQWKKAHSGTAELQRQMNSLYRECKSNTKSKKDLRESSYGASIAELMRVGQYDAEPWLDDYGKHHRWTLRLEKDMPAASVPDWMGDFTTSFNSQFPGQDFLAVLRMAQTTLTSNGEPKPKSRSGEVHRDWFYIRSSDSEEGACDLYAARQFDAGEVIGFLRGHYTKILGEEGQSLFDFYGRNADEVNVPAEYAKYAIIRDHASRPVLLCMKLRQQWSSDVPLFMGLHYMSHESNSNTVLLSNGMVRARKRIDKHDILTLNYWEMPANVSDVTKPRPFASSRGAVSNEGTDQPRKRKKLSADPNSVSVKSFFSGMIPDVESRPSSIRFSVMLNHQLLDDLRKCSNAEQAEECYNRFCRQVSSEKQRCT